MAESLKSTSLGQVSPMADKGVSLKVLLLFLLWQIIPLLAPLIFLAKVVPVFIEVYKGFGAKLPPLTVYICNASVVAQRYFVLLFLHTIVGCVVINYLAGCLGGQRALIWLTVCIWLGCLLLLDIGVIGMFLPIYKMSP